MARRRRKVDDRLASHRGSLQRTTSRLSHRNQFSQKLQVRCNLEFLQYYKRVFCTFCTPVFFRELTWVGWNYHLVRSCLLSWAVWIWSGRACTIQSQSTWHVRLCQEVCYLASSLCVCSCACEPTQLPVSSLRCKTATPPQSTHLSSLKESWDHHQPGTPSRGTNSESLERTASNQQSTRSSL